MELQQTPSSYSQDKDFKFTFSLVCKTSLYTQELLSSVFLIISILLWEFISFWFWLALTWPLLELFQMSVAIWVHCFDQPLFDSTAQLLIQLLVFDTELHKIFVYFGQQSFIRYIICKYFLLFYRLLTSFVVSFAVSKLFSVINYYLLFAFMIWGFDFMCIRLLRIPMSRGFPPAFLLVALWFQFLFLSLWSIFRCRVYIWSNFLLYQWISCLLNATLWRD